MMPKLQCNSVGIRGIARVLGIAVNAVACKILQLAASIVKPAIPMNRRSFEVNEIRTYIGNKEDQNWVAYSLCSETRQVVDFIAGKRNKRNLRMIVNTLLLSGVEQIKTDKLNIYHSLIPRKRHISNAYNINHIERYNLNIRTQLKRLSRRTVCFSKSLLTVYIWILYSVLI